MFLVLCLPCTSAMVRKTEGSGFAPQAENPPLPEFGLGVIFCGAPDSLAVQLLLPGPVLRRLRIGVRCRLECRAGYPTISVARGESRPARPASSSQRRSFPRLR